MNCAFTFWKWINWADQGGCLPYTFLLYNLHLRFLATRSWKLFTYSTVQNPSWEANWFAASQEIPRISQNPKFHYRTHKLPPPVSILGQPNPVHIPTSHLLEIHPNIIHPSTPRSPQWSPFLRFPHQHPIHSPLLTHTRHTQMKITCTKTTVQHCHSPLFGVSFMSHQFELKRKPLFFE